MLFFTRIELVACGLACVLACAQAVARIKWKRLKVTLFGLRNLSLRLSQIIGLVHQFRALSNLVKMKIRRNL